MNAKKFILPVLIVFLCVLYVVSFLPSVKGEKQYPVMETALLNSHYSEYLSEIKISSQNSAIVLENKAGFWEGKAISNASAGDFPIVHTFPADQTIMERTTANLQNIIKIQKVSDSKKNLANFGLDDENAVTISYNTTNETTGTFSVGKMDFSKHARYILFQNYEGIFKTEFDFNELLYTTARQWYDPYIIPRSLFHYGSEVLRARIMQGGVQRIYTPTGSESDERLLELRHGSLGIWRVQEEAEATVVFEMTLGEFLTLDFARTDDDFLVRSKSSAIPDFEYCYHISEWTYKNIFEILL